MENENIPTHDPQTGDLNPHYEELVGNKNPMEIKQEIKEMTEEEQRDKERRDEELRDKVAIAFMQVIISKPTEVIEKDYGEYGNIMHAIAVDAYEMADAMVDVAWNNKPSYLKN